MLRGSQTCATLELNNLPLLGQWLHESKRTCRSCEQIEFLPPGRKELDSIDLGRLVKIYRTERALNSNEPRGIIKVHKCVSPWRCQQTFIHPPLSGSANQIYVSLISPNSECIVFRQELHPI